MEAAALPEPQADEVRNQLRRILSSETFADKERLRTLLRYIVEEKLSNHASRLKEYSLATAVFGRGEDFDLKNDSIVRVQMRNLRKNLDAYYENEGREDPLRIEIPKGSYVPQFTERGAGHEAGRRGGVRPADIALPLLALALAVTAAVFLLVAQGRATASTVAVLPFLAAAGGAEEEAAAASLAEEVMAELAKEKSIRTVSAEPRHLEYRAAVIMEAGRRHRAGTVLTGVVRKSGQQWYVTVRLVRVDDGVNLWSNSYTVPQARLDSLARLIGRAVVEALGRTES
jgi:adenylate cyclase